MKISRPVRPPSNSTVFNPLAMASVSEVAASAPHQCLRRADAYNNDMRMAASVWCAAAVLAVHVIGLQAQQPPPPQPFPRPGAPPVASPQPPPGTPPAAPAAAAARPPAAPSAPGDKPTDASLGVPGIINPKAEFLD